MNPKRIFDILFSLTVLILISPVMLIAAIAIKLESKGPVIYLSKRVGQYYSLFDLIKFRTMATDADLRINQMKHLNQYAAKEEQTNECPKCKAAGHACSAILIDANGQEICEDFYLAQKHLKMESPFMKFQNDPRVTKVGQFLRSTSIDELPQLINILKGDMSLVGNRPLPIYEAEQLTRDNSAERFMAPAGLTGLWQVTKRGKKGELSAKERIDLDITYARDYSLMYDLKLILKTFPALLQQENV
jgi:lipopolysaccharide/colanic/teichoic acid biosynthesis glycosyltransferase